MSKSSRIVAAVCSVALLAETGAAIAADGSSQITVHAPTQLKAGQTAPFDVSGVKAIRRGQPIPAGYVLVGQQVDVSLGAKYAGAALKFTCPDAKRLKTFGVTGHAGFFAPQNYGDHRTATIMSFRPRTCARRAGRCTRCAAEHRLSFELREGEEPAGAAYALPRWVPSS